MKADLIGLIVADMDASLAFYRRLGLEFPAGAESENHVETTLPGGLRLAFDPVADVQGFDPAWSPPTGSPRVALAFLCESPGDVDAKYTELVGLGYGSRRPPWDAVWGQRYAMLLDPDGNGVDLFAPS